MSRTITCISCGEIFELDGPLLGGAAKCDECADTNSDSD
jgi:hypothetical protein